jgi:hypothetical protein
MHVDIFPEEIKPVCKVNYIISCADPDAVTLSQDANDPTIFHSYPSVPHTAWLLDTGLPHEVKSQGCREILEFKLNIYVRVKLIEWYFGSCKSNKLWL